MTKQEMEYIINNAFVSLTKVFLEVEKSDQASKVLYESLDQALDLIDICRHEVKK